MRKPLSVSGTLPTSPAIDSIVRTGVLHVTTKGLFGMRFWKPRFVILTRTKLFFYIHEGGELKLELDISACTHEDIESMPTDCTNKFSPSIWRIAVNNIAGKRYFLAACSEYEMNMWTQDLYETAHQRMNPQSELRPSLGVHPRFVEACYLHGDVVGSKFRASIRRPPPPRMSNLDISAIA